MFCRQTEITPEPTTNPSTEGESVTTSGSESINTNNNNNISNNNGVPTPESETSPNATESNTDTTTTDANTTNTTTNTQTYINTTTSTNENENKSESDNKHKSENDNPPQQQEELKTTSIITPNVTEPPHADAVSAALSIKDHISFNNNQYSTYYLLYMTLNNTFMILFFDLINLFDHFIVAGIPPYAQAKRGQFLKPEVLYQFPADKPYLLFYYFFFAVFLIFILFSFLF